MKTEQQQQAQHLYFQTDLSKSEIADMLNISRRSLHYWVRENDWDRLKKSSQNMPSLIAENCYMIMAKLSESILSELRIMKPITKQEADTLHKLILTINKLKNRNTLNENLEMMTYFMQSINQKDPAMAQAIKPFVNDYIASQASVQPWQFMPGKFNDMGFIPKDGPASGSKLTEEQLDLQDLMAWSENNPNDTDTTETPAPNPSPAPAPATPSAAQPSQTSSPSYSNPKGDSTGEAIRRQATLAAAEMLSKQNAQEAIIEKQFQEITKMINPNAPNIIPKPQHNNRATRRKMAKMTKKAA